MEIRPLDHTHRATVISLWERCGLSRPWNPPDEDFDRAQAGPTSTILGALDDGVVVGAVMVGHDGHRGWIYYLAVDPVRHRAGTGRALMDAAEDWLRSASVPKVQLMVRSANSATLGFYDALGFATEDVVVRSRWLRAPTATD